MITRSKLIIKDKVVNFIVRINILKSLSVKPCAAVCWLLKTHLQSRQEQNLSLFLEV